MRQRKKKQKRAAVNKGTAGFRMSDEVWAVLEPLLPKHRNTHRFGGGKPRTPDRQCADAIFYVLRTFKPQELCTLLTKDVTLRERLGFPRVPHRRTVERRLDATLPEAEAQVQALGQHLPVELTPGADHPQ